MKAPKQALLLDMDGVTIDTEPLYTKAEINLFKEYGVEIPEEDWFLFKGASEKKFYELSMQRYEIKENLEVFMKKGRNYVKDEFSKGIPFMDGFKSMHKRISPYFFMGLVTASPRHSLNKIILNLNLKKYFKNIISGEDANKNKPYPDPYIFMMKALNVTPNNTIIIEDSLTGLRSAISSGAHVIAKTGSTPIEKLSHIHHIIDHLDEITVNFLEEILQKTK